MEILSLKTSYWNFARLPAMSISKLIMLTALLLTLFFNSAFFSNTYEVYAEIPGGLLFMMSLALFLFAVTTLLLSLLCYRFITKPVLVFVLLSAALANYYMNRFNIVIDTTMLTNVRETDPSEAADLINPFMLAELFFMGLVPAVLIAKTNIVCQGFGREIVQRLKLIGFSFILVVASIIPFTSYYTGFFREHKLLRYYANPATFLYSAGKSIEMALANSENTIRIPIGMDAHIPATDLDRELIILVVGEAVRADHLGLNGYEKQTTPLLAGEDIISFRQMYSCGTATAYSVPCMFAVDGREDFDLDDSRNQENLLDVLTHAGVNVLWRDNNSDSKGVASAVPFEDFRESTNNTVCDIECRDIGMLSGLDDFIELQENGDIVIVLHQMGNHGPAYFKRFTQEFAQFQPYCQTARLETCSDEEISNAYDNALLYTDYFLHEVITFLKKYDNQFETAMFYMSDHGESLGENGLYLHGMPWLFAPDNQKHVASMLWLGKGFKIDRSNLKSQKDKPTSQDNYFHSVLGLLEIDTQLYQKEKDLTAFKSELTLQ